MFHWLRNSIGWLMRHRDYIDLFKILDSWFFFATLNEIRCLAFLNMSWLSIDHFIIIGMNVNLMEPVCQFPLGSTWYSSEPRSCSRDKENQSKNMNWQNDLIQETSIIPWPKYLASCTFPFVKTDEQTCSLKKCKRS